MSLKKTIVEVNNVSFAYEKNFVLKDISFAIQEGSFVGLVGPNGSGKSTLTKIILGMLKPTEGEVRLFGESIQKFNNWRKIGYVSQKANSFNSGFPATVFEVVLSGLASKTGLFHFYSKKDKLLAEEMIELVGMKESMRKNIGQLSGGQQQRIFIARALVSEPRLLILDEPTVGVDAQNVEHFYHILSSLNKTKGLTLLMISHDIGTITEHATHVACLNRTLHFHGDSHTFAHLDENELSAFYGHHVHILTHDHGGH